MSDWRSTMKVLVGREPCCTLRLDRPPSINFLYENAHGFGVKKSRIYKDWIRQANLDMWGQRYPLLDTPIAVIYELPKKYQVEDVGNFEKAASDFLKHRGVIKDDSLIWFNAQTWGNSREMMIYIFRL